MSINVHQSLCLTDWDIDYCQPAVSKIDIYVTVVLNVSTDIYLISIPAPMLFKARLRWREKIELLILFSGGLFVMMAGILRCVLILTVSLTYAPLADSTLQDLTLMPPVGGCQRCRASR